MGNETAAIIAVVTTKPETIQGGGAPVFIVKDHTELQSVGMTLEKVTDATTYEIDTDTLILVAR